MHALRELLSPPYVCGQYVHILTRGPYAGLWGWAMAHEYRYRENRWYTAVNDRADLCGVWRWFPTLTLAGSEDVQESE